MSAVAKKDDQNAEMVAPEIARAMGRKQMSKREFRRQMRMISILIVLSVLFIICVRVHAQERPGAGWPEGASGAWPHHRHHHCEGPTPGENAPGAAEPWHRCGSHQWHHDGNMGQWPGRNVVG